jgi:lysophospholipase L1-like esterase
MYKKLLMLSIPVFTVILIGLANAKSLDSQSGTLNIVSFGDSITYGSGDQNRIGYIGRIEKLLENTKRINVEITNYGVSKYRTSQVIKQLRKTTAISNEIKNADYITVFIGTNDFRKSANYKFDEINESNLNSGKRQFTSNLKRILSIIRYDNKEAPVIVLGLYNPYNKQVGVMIEAWNTEIEALTVLFQEVYFVPTIDLFTNKSYYADHLHPNKKGYDQLARRLYEKILTLEAEALTKE